MYDTATNEFGMADRLPIDNNLPMSVVHCDELFLIGGETGEGFDEREDWVRIEFMRVTKAIGLPHVTAPKTFRHTFATILQDANVDPLIRNELMGHSPVGTYGSAGSLGTTGIYTHTRPETKRRQLEQALRDRPAVSYAQTWLDRRRRIAD